MRWYGNRRERLHGVDRERGASAVEFALVSVVLFTMLLGIIEVGRLLYLQNAVTAAAQEAARAIAGNPGMSVDTVKVRVSRQVPAINVDNLSLEISVSKAKREVVVKATYPYEPIVPIVFSSGLQLRATARLRY